MSRKRLIIIAIVAAVLVLPLFVMALVSHPAKKATSTASNSTSTDNTNTASDSTNTPAAVAVPNNAAVLQAAAQQAPQSGITPATATVLSVSPLGNGWFSSSVQQSNSTGENEQLLFKQQSDGSLELVAGPGTAFAKSVLDDAGVPTSVQDLLLVYNDD